MMIILNFIPDDVSELNMSSHQVVAKFHFPYILQMIN